MLVYLLEDRLEEVGELVYMGIRECFGFTASVRGRDPHTTPFQALWQRLPK